MLPHIRTVQKDSTRVGNGTGWDEIYQSQYPIPSRICKWDEKMFQSRFYIFFWTKIYLNPVPKEMGSSGIPSQLKKFSFLIGNETGWDEICQSHSRPTYVIGIKCSTPIPKFFYETKICLNLVPNEMRSRKIPFHREKLPSLDSTIYLYSWMENFASMFPCLLGQK